MSDYPVINGQMVSWAEIGISLNIHEGEGVNTSDFASIKWEAKLEPGVVRGVGPGVLGRTVGQYEASAEIAMYWDAGMRFKRALAMLNPKIGLVTFDVNITWSPLHGEGETFTVSLIGCRIAGSSTDAAPGPDATSMTLPLSILRVEEDGIALV